MKRLFTFCLTFLGAFLFSSSVFADDKSPKEEIIQWAVGQMVSWTPPGKSILPEAKETEEEGLKRYNDIAEAAFNASFSPDEPSVFKGPNGRSKTMALILSIAHTESGFRKDVDLGIGKAARGDSGRSWCMMQVMLSNLDPKTQHTRMRVQMDGTFWKYAYDGDTGWGGEDLVRDRSKCFTTGLHMIRVSMRSCEFLPLMHRLSVYTSGSCMSEKGRVKSRVQMSKALRWLKSSPPVAFDLSIMTPSDPAVSLLERGIDRSYDYNLVVALVPEAPERGPRAVPESLNGPVVSQSVSR